LKQAGWEIKGKQLVNKKTGAPFKFEILLVQPNFERIALPFKKNLARLGIEMNIRVVDPAQFINRRRDYDFDMIVTTFPQSESPGNEQREYWSSSAADIPGTRNFVGIKNPVIDELIEQIISAPNREQLVYATRALDRVLLWEHYVIPQFYSAKYRVAWWIDPEKHATLVDYKKNLND
jgi:microcin C transport system substrate-binding protein